MGESDKPSQSATPRTDAIATRDLTAEELAERKPITMRENLGGEYARA